MMASEALWSDLPVIDISALAEKSESAQRLLAEQISRACREFGFFYIVGHGIDPILQERLMAASQAFFAQDLPQKMTISMDKGGHAWRGYFPVGQELTSGRPDNKEGLYFGQEISREHPLAALPMHGPNLFPDGDQFGLKALVLSYMEQMTELGHRLVAALSLGLGLDSSFFDEHYTKDPLTLFRIFHYPAPGSGQEVCGVGEHTDYGLLTILWQDDCGGLEVKIKGKWHEAPPVAGSFICNLGDMLERMTKGVYLSTPHRVIRQVAGKSRYSFPFFFDPNYHAQVAALDLPVGMIQKASERWDQMDVHQFEGTYGEYLLGKVGKVFPALLKAAIRK